MNFVLIQSPRHHILSYCIPQDTMSDFYLAHNDHWIYDYKLSMDFPSFICKNHKMWYVDDKLYRKYGPSLIDCHISWHYMLYSSKNITNTFKSPEYSIDVDNRYIAWCHNNSKIEYNPIPEDDFMYFVALFDHEWYLRGRLKN